MGFWNGGKKIVMLERQAIYELSFLLALQWTSNTHIQNKYLVKL